MGKLVRAVHVTDPKSGRRLVLAPGEEPAPHLAALVKNPAAWEGGKLPTAAKKDTAKDDASGADSAPSGDADQSDTGTSAQDEPAEDTKPAAKKTAARKTAASKTAAN